MYWYEFNSENVSTTRWKNLIQRNYYISAKAVSQHPIYYLLIAMFYKMYYNHTVGRGMKYEASKELTPC
jgi:hypothetical protein